MGLVDADMYESSHKEHVLVRKLFNNEALGQTTLNPMGYKNHSFHHVFQARVGGPAVYGSLHNNARLRDEVCLKKANRSSLAPEAKTRKQKLEQNRHKPGAEMSIGGSSDYLGHRAPVPGPHTAMVSCHPHFDLQRCMSTMLEWTQCRWGLIMTHSFAMWVGLIIHLSGVVTSRGQGFKIKRRGEGAAPPPAKRHMSGVYRITLYLP